MASTELKDAGASAREEIILNIHSLEHPFDDAGRAQLAAILPEFISRRRWYRAKARTIENATVEDVLPVYGIKSFVLVVRLDYTFGDSDRYVLTLAFANETTGHSRSEAQEVLARYKTSDGQEGSIREAFSQPDFRQWLLSAISCNRRLEGRHGHLIASHTDAFQNQCDDSALQIESSISGAEQSNTSLIYGDRFILKVFRKIEEGINPDVEIGKFLTARGFRHSPAVLGTLEYRSGNDEAVYAAGILQEFVRNQGDAWKYTLESLSGFFERALAWNQPVADLPTDHPLELTTHQIPDEARKLLGAYADSAHLLGIRTAEMHAALADPEGGPDFTPESFVAEDGEKLYEEMLGQADITLELLRRKQAALADTVADMAREILRSEHRLMERFSPLRDRHITAARIRFHGDFHLGQVLYTGRDFMIIDFEGEPARPLGERRAKTLATRDVAGMIRSFQYAAYAALFGQVSGVPAKPESMGAVELWAAFWTAWISATYLNGYFSRAGELPFVSRDASERRLLFDAFLLQKALYEVAYELNNRPDWVRIPLGGILSLIS